MPRKRSSVAAPARIRDRSFPSLPLPFSLPYTPMEAKRESRLPAGEEWQYEPKWDGFRCLVFRAGETVVLQSKAGQALSRYFPELVAVFHRLPHRSFVLDGEIVILREGRLAFDDLLMRIHPAESRIAKLAKETPATVFVFDLLYDPSDGLLVDLPLTERRSRLERFFEQVYPSPLIQMTPITRDRNIACEWFETLRIFGCDGVMAKKLHEPYHAGERDAMTKVKRLKTADCVVGGFRYSDADASSVGSLLLGLYDETGILHHVGHTSSFNREERKQLIRKIEPLKGGTGFSGRAPGGPSRWSTRRSDEWQPVAPTLVCEVQYDYFSHHRFRHGAKFLRWRPEKDSKACRLDQVETTRHT
jgi:ATP-dependent DNA ligase